MNIKMIEILSCPYHQNNDLRITVKNKNEEDILEGKLVCSLCKRTFPIIAGIPHLLPDELLKKNTSQSYEKWQIGERPWQPDFVSAMLSGIKTKKPKDLITDQFCLNIGCGERSDLGINIVNVDIYIPQNMPQNFILASAEYLPFKENTFDIVESSYVIEHLIRPADFIQKQVAISKHKVIIVTDNSEWIGDLWFRITHNGRIFHSEHYYRWTVEYLENLIKRLGYKSVVKACNLSPSYIVKIISKLGRLPRIGRCFYRDIIGEIYKEER